jgi:hypothetical protein
MPKFSVTVSNSIRVPDPPVAMAWTALRASRHDGATGNMATSSKYPLNAVLFFPIRNFAHRSPDAA